MAFMNSLQKNEIFEAEVEGYTSEGFGVCRLDGRAVFVPRVIVGERWRIKLVKVTETAVYGRALEPLLLSPERREPSCVNYLRCGGCSLLHMSYEEEKRLKLTRLNDALRHIGHQSVFAKEIIGSDSCERYRNKGIYTVRQTADGAACGFFAPRSHELVPITDCHIQSTLSNRAAGCVTAFLSANGIPAYDEKTHRGTVRSVFVRCARSTPDAVCCVVSAGGLGAKTEPLVKALRESCPELTGIVLNINKTQGNSVLAGDFYTLYGSEIMRDSLGGIEYGISPQAFFQINPPQAERLYDKAMEYACAGERKTALDLYCGAGTISLYLARHFERVIGAEIVPEAIENAKRNAENNGIKNAEFICADASMAAESFLSAGVRPDAVIVDPPRKGMDGGAIEAICSMSPERVVYVSCNPSTLARDIERFSLRGYLLTKAIALDMFPRTSHVEAVVLLSKTDKKTAE